MAVLIRVLDFPDVKELSSEEVRELMESKWGMLRRTVEAADAEILHQQPQERKEGNTFEEVMELVQSCPCKPASFIANKLEISEVRVNSCLNEAEKKGLLERKKVVAGKSVFWLPEFTAEGIKIYGSQEKLLKGGLGQDFFARAIQQHYEKIGLKELRMEFEYFINDKQSIDIVVLRKTERVKALEIELDDNWSHIIANIKKCLSAKFEEVEVAVSNQSRAKKLRKIIESEFTAKEQGKIAVEVLTKYVSDTPLIG